MGLNGLTFLIVSQHFARFNGHSSCVRKDTAPEIFYVTLQEHMIKGFDDFMEGNSSLYIPTLSKLIAIDIVLLDIQLL